MSLNPSKKVLKTYYKMRQLCYESRRLFIITNCGLILLQNELAFLLQNAPISLHNAAVSTKCADFITKRRSYYKTSRLLQNEAVQR